MVVDVFCREVTQSAERNVLLNKNDALPLYLYISGRHIFRYTKVIYYLAIAK